MARPTGRLLPRDRLFGGDGLGAKAVGGGADGGLGVDVAITAGGDEREQGVADIAVVDLGDIGGDAERGGLADDLQRVEEPGQRGRYAVEHAVAALLRLL